jgi:hypothetical protein
MVNALARQAFNFIISGRDAILKLSRLCRQRHLPPVTLDTSGIETSRVRIEKKLVASAPHIAAKSQPALPRASC